MPNEQSLKISIPRCLLVTAFVAMGCAAPAADTDLADEHTEASESKLTLDRMLYRYYKPNPPNCTEYRCFGSPGNGDRLYTAWPMYENLSGYTLEGITMSCSSTPESSSVPLLRLRSPVGYGAHYYTTDPIEAQVDVNGYNFVLEDSNVCQVYNYRRPGTCPVYRLSDGTDYLLTLSPTEKNNAIAKYGYTLKNGVYADGAAFFAFPQGGGSCPG